MASIRPKEGAGKESPRWRYSRLELYGLRWCRRFVEGSDCCRFLVFVPICRRLLELLPVAVPLPTPCDVNFSSGTDFISSPIRVVHYFAWYQIYTINRGTSVYPFVKYWARCNRSKAPSKLCLFSIPPPSQDFFFRLAWVGSASE